MPPTDKTPQEIFLEFPKLPDMEAVINETVHHFSVVSGYPEKADKIKTFLEKIAATQKETRRFYVRIRVSEDQLEIKTSQNGYNWE